MPSAPRRFSKTEVAIANPIIKAMSRLNTWAYRATNGRLGGRFMPGAPVLRYGEEIGMGDDLSLPDRESLRTPMQWTDAPAGGFTTSERPVRPVIADGPYGYPAVNVRAHNRYTFPPGGCWRAKRIQGRAEPVRKRIVTRPTHSACAFRTRPRRAGASPHR